MAYSLICGDKQSGPTSSDVKSFLTKVEHEIAYTETDSRVFVKNIKTGVTLDQLKSSLQSYGALQIYLYEAGKNNDGWAWIGFEDKEAANRLIAESEIINEAKETDQVKSEKEGSEKFENDSNSDSFYAEENDDNLNNQDEEED
ncbi:RNA-binding protein, putative [Hepatocystis sp. ex Piliocolobus tephrosceles]|nr:RNA-binding protein, putative [Hepatocystis sp. ex Piliocolobus tephrosceles]